MRFLGIDPGLATIGLGLIECERGQEPRTLEWLTIETKPDRALPDRLKEIHKDLRSYIKNAKPDLVILETLYFSVNAKTALTVAQARGVILFTIAEAQIPLREVSPVTLKQAITGYGKSDKRAMQEMLVRLLHLDKIPKPDDAADALALAVYGSLADVEGRMIC